ncbi:MAG: hypothetical protein WCO52_04715 [bacterium]
MTKALVKAPVSPKLYAAYDATVVGKVCKDLLNQGFVVPDDLGRELHTLFAKRLPGYKGSHADAYADVTQSSVAEMYKWGKPTIEVIGNHDKRHVYAVRFCRKNKPSTKWFTFTVDEVATAAYYLCCNPNLEVSKPGFRGYMDPDFVNPEALATVAKLRLGTPAVSVTEQGFMLNVKQVVWLQHNAMPTLSKMLRGHRYQVGALLPR